MNKLTKHHDLRSWLLMAVLLTFSIPAVASDWMTNSTKFSMSNSKDHVTFKVFLCDLDGSNTYAKSDGTIFAVNSAGRKLYLMDIWYIEEGDDSNPFGKVHARIDISNSKAWFTNGYGTPEQQIEFGGKDFLITKWGSDNHYCTPSIDYYYPATMAGQSWTFYYQYKHSGGSSYKMTLGTATLSATMNYSHFNSKDYQMERTGPDKIKFTVPKLPNDVSTKLSDFHIHEGSYKVTFSYKKQDNSTESQTETFSCDKLQKKEYTVTIPASVGNPKQVDVKVEATDRLKDSGNGSYWKDTYTYNSTNVFKVVPVPSALRMDYRQFDKMADLSWNAYTSSGNILTCTPYIYRMETDANGKPVGAGTWSRRGKITNAGSNQSLSYSDNGVQQESYYKYMVLNVPKDWDGNSINAASLNNPDEALLKKLGYVESDILYTKPTMSIYGLAQDITVPNKVKLEWQYTRVPTSSSTVKFQVMRRTSPDVEWSEYGTVTGDAEPAAGAKLSFTDANLPNANVRYQYMIRLSLNEGRSLFQSDPLTAGMLEGSSVKSFTATKGTHEGTVRLTWEARQAGSDNTTYVISRRYVDSEDDFIQINTTTGTAELYTYEDNTVQPGYYYEYKIEVYSGSLVQNVLHDVGFCQARGVVSGRITYGTGASVEDVRLTLRGSGDGDDVITGLSKRIDGASTGIAWSAEQKEMTKVFGSDKAFTVQLFIRPDDNLSAGAVIGEIPGVGRLVLGSKNDEGYQLMVSQVNGNHTTNAYIPFGTYSLLTVIQDGSYASFLVNDKPSQTEVPVQGDDEAVQTFSVGGATGVSEAQAFRGNITEVRVFDHVLTPNEQATYADRLLNGRERGLKLYWPMDEGLGRYVFDASYSNDMPNGRHAEVGSNVSVSNIVPVDAQLSRYAVTDANGEYIIRGIPFIGSGSTYTVTPTRGIHEFSPTSRNGFIGSGNLTLNSYDFTDVSSFPVKGKITYLNTNIPADSIQFKIDGNFVQTRDGMVMTDTNGEYELSVPIGRHLIEAFKEGHRLTSFPLDGTSYDFKQAEIVNFFDSTLVNVTGRINGGYSDQDAPLSFGASKNRLGKATIKLSLGRESQCSFNYIVDEHGDGSFGTQPIPVESATEDIKSTAYRAGGSHDDTYYIYITTDEETGEFSALLPPLKYQVESIKFVGGSDYDNLPIFSQNLPVLNATNTVSDKQPSDSLLINNTAYKYKYAAKMIRQYRATPSISVTQQGMKNGAFGQDTVPVTTLTNTVDDLQVVTYTGNGYNYVFGHPIFCQSERYAFDIKVGEDYKNLDTGETFTEVPRDAVIHIVNDASILTQVFAEKVLVDGKEVEAGGEYDTPNIEIVPDSTGTVFYEFEGGWPNLAEGHIRNLSISVRVDGRTTMWEAPNSKTEALDLILLGSLPTGTNFMTAGPDKVDYIIRRPPGSTSVASLETTTIDNYSKSSLLVHDSSFGGGAYVSLSPTWEINYGPATGFFSLLEKTKIQVVANTTNTRNDGHKDSDYITDYNDTYTVSEKISTPSKMVYSLPKNQFIPEYNDTYIGRSTNLTFSKARLLGFYQQSDGSYKLAEKDGVSVSESFDTQFSYTQAYIIDVLIPNWKALIKDRLIHVDGNHWDPANSPTVPGQVTYYTSYKEDDPEWCHANGDKEYWGSKYSERQGSPGYVMRDGTNEGAIDEVEFAINQIRSWEAKIAQNEADKLSAFENSENFLGNYSISGGTSVTHVNKTERKNTHQVKDETYWCINDDAKLGFLFNAAGTYGIMTWKNSTSVTNQTDTTRTESKSVSWTLSDSDPRTALSVDVYNSPNNWGPIFRTRGGQTVNPYEPETYTEYYAKGTKLNEGTMRVELPELKVMGSTEQTDVPAGGEARFTLQLHNGSETNAQCTYLLEVKDDSNPNGATLLIDGTPLSNGRAGRSIKMKGDETVELLLIVKQSDRSIVDYDDIRIVLKSENDVSAVSDPVKLRVHFVPASAHVDLAVDHTVLNKAYMKENNGLMVTFYNLDLQDQGLHGLRLRYRRKGNDAWSMIKQWSRDSRDWTMGYEQLPDSSTFRRPVSFLEDGTYELQAQTFGKYGNEDVTYETEPITVTQDTRGPQVLGMPSPEDGQLTYTFRNNMHVRFNEELNNNSLSKSDNFTIYGDMNNVALNTQFPDVALQLNGDEVRTEAVYELSNSDFAVGFWLYRKSDGTIISMGTEDNTLALFTHDGGRLAARVGDADQTYDTENIIPAEKWTYVALSYWVKDEDNPDNRISMLFVNSDMASPEEVGRDVPANAFEAIGKLTIGGNGFVGMMHDLTLWNVKKSIDELYQTRSQLKASYTPGLIGYWRMNEGHGTTLTDKARSRDIVMADESWYINNSNLAAHLDGTQPLKVDISTFNPLKTDNFALEMWFRAERTENNASATLMQLPGVMTIRFLDSKMTMDITNHTSSNNGTLNETGDRVVLSDANYIDNVWHHFTLNVRRGTSAIFYIDGKAVKTLPESSIPVPSGSRLYVGGGSSDSDVKLLGDVDEVRIWSAALTSDVIDNRRYERLDNTYAGLVGYFPMESIGRTETGTVVSEFSTANMGQKDSQLALEGTPSQAATAPALLPGSQYMRLEDRQFNFTASKNEAYFSFPDDVLPLMDGNDFTVSVHNIKDEHGNNSEPVEWMFHTDFACVKWDSWHSVPINKHWSESMDVIVELHNTTGQPQSYEITGQPSWMEVSEPIGTLNEAKEITLTIKPTVPVGRYTEYLYVTDRYGMQRVAKLTIVVEGDEPEWAVDPDLYESNMTLTGQIYVGDKISEFTESKIAAFDDMGLCRGVAQPKYVSTRDAYFVDMIIYGAAATELSTGERDLTFRLYDASTGTVYPVVMVTVPNSSPSRTVTYAPDATIGSYNNPVVFRSTNDLMQNLDLARGWTWTSFYLQPASTAINDVLPKTSAAIRKFKNIKSKTAFAVANTDCTGFLGELEDLVPGQMYKIQVSSSTPFEVFGTTIDVTATTQTIYPNYNWIGSLSNTVMSVAEAFAELEPTKDDMVKTRTAMATYNGQGVWEGTLQNIVPGEGYIYLSKAQTAKTFHYPNKHTSSRSALMAPQQAPALTHYQPVDEHLYPDNMNIIAVVIDDGQRVEDAEVAAFVGGECRGAVTSRNGYYFLTILGDSNADINNPVELRVFDGTEEYYVGSVSFVSDAFYGTLNAPYEFNLDATGIDSIHVGDDNVEWYTLSGIKLAKKPTLNGVYIANGRKVVVKGEKYYHLK